MPVYSYSAPQTDLIHAVLRASYRTEAPAYNHIRVEGFDSINNLPVIVNCFDYDDIANSNARFMSVEDVNISSVDEATGRAESILRKDRSACTSGYIEIHPNCAQQVYDVINISDSKAGFVNERRRIIGINTFFQPACGKYLQTLLLAKV